MDVPLSLNDLLQRLDVPGVRAIVLMGSYARDEAGPYSDIDLVRFIDDTQQPSGAGSYLYDGRLVVVSDVTPEQVEKWFHDPDGAVQVIRGARNARVLLDRKGYFAAIQARVEAFRWDEAMQTRANHWASEILVGLIEEVHKGLEGLRRQDVGRMLNARFGCSWVLGRVMRVQRGVLLSGDNDFYQALTREMSWQPEWVRLFRTAYGIEDEQGNAPFLAEQVKAGLQLYVLTAELLGSILRPEDAPLVQQTAELVRTTLAHS